jgi:soluble lytic murein transglycosylase
MMRTARRRRRRRRLLRLVIPLAVLVAIIVVAVGSITGWVVIPGLSGKVYPIHYEKEIAAVAEKYDVDPYLLAAVARTESGFDPDAKSHAGAVGLMQFLPNTAEFVTGLDSWKGPKNPALRDPQDSLELGACYLAYLLRRFDDQTAALAGYNAGPNAVAGWIEKAGGADSFTAEDIRYPETREFVRRVVRSQALYEKAHPDAFSAAGRHAWATVSHLLAASSG